MSLPRWSLAWGIAFETVPPDRLISLADLMQPLQLPAGNTAGVLRYLLSEDVHPPFYFVLANVWMRWFSTDSGLVSLGLARSLPAWFGVAAIPAMFGLSWLLLRSIVVSQLATAMMALSPFAVYLAQEARHYTFGVLWVIASLSCLVLAVQRLRQRRVLSIGLMLSWVVVNGLGIASHYFFMISLTAMTIALGRLCDPASWLRSRPTFERSVAATLSSDFGHGDRGCSLVADPERCPQSRKLPSGFRTVSRLTGSI